MNSSEDTEHNRKHGNIWGILWLVLFFGSLIGGAVISSRLDAQSKLSQIVFGAVTLVVLIGQLPVLCWLLRRETRKFGLNCPACDKPLIGVAAQVAIAADHCGHCGTRLFSDNPPPKDSSPAR